MDSNETHILVPQRTLPVADKVDVLVCGGGVAGIAAAVSAARNGARTLLIERAGFLGGTATGSSMGLIVIPAGELAGFPREFFARLAAEQGAALGEAVPWDIEAYKWTAMSFLKEAGAELLLYTWVSEPIMEAGRIAGVVVENKSGRQAILARTVIDTTGDGDVAARAGAAFVKGREEDGAMRPVTVMGRIGNIDLGAMLEYQAAHPGDFVDDDGRRARNLEAGVVLIDGFFEAIRKGREAGIVSASNPLNCIRFSGVKRRESMDRAILICNSTRVYDVDATVASDITRAEFEGRRQLREVVELCRRHVPGCERSFLVDTSAYLGVRETRRIKGRRTLTYEDIRDRRPVEDSIAVISHHDYGSADTHGSAIAYDSAHAHIAPPSRMLRFEFPLSCLLPESVGNLLVAGRCASVTHDVDKFSRNMAPTGLVGQAAGLVAAVMARAPEADWSRIPVRDIQARLEAQGVPVHLADSRPAAPAAMPSRE